MSIQARVLIVGSGSIANRYLRLCCETSEYDVRQTSESGRWIQSRLFVEYETAKSQNWDLVIVCTTPNNHIRNMREFQDRTSRILCEKPLRGIEADVDTELLSLDESKIIISSPWKHTNGFQLVKSQIPKLGTITSIRAKSSSSLKDWRPSRSLHQGFWFDPTQGGVRSELIHELDLIWGLIGPLEEVFSLGLPEKELHESAISYSFAMYRSQSQSLPMATIELDWASNVVFRRMEFFGHQGRLEWDLVKSRMCLVQANGSEFCSNTEDDDRDEHFRKQIAFCLREPLTGLTTLKDAEAQCKAIWRAE